jgi:hypothetical protein
MTAPEKYEAFNNEIHGIEIAYRETLQFPISYYFEWRTYPFELRYNIKRVLDPDIKNAVMDAYETIYRQAHFI